MALIDSKKAYDSRTNVDNIVQKFTKYLIKSLILWLIPRETGGWIAEVKILWGIFKEDSLWPLLYVIAMMTLNYVFTKSHWNINHFMHIESIKVFSKNEKVLEILIETIKIQRKCIGMQFGIEMKATT